MIIATPIPPLVAIRVHAESLFTSSSSFHRWIAQARRKWLSTDLNYKQNSTTTRSFSEQAQVSLSGDTHVEAVRSSLCVTRKEARLPLHPRRKFVCSTCNLKGLFPFSSVGKGLCILDVCIVAIAGVLQDPGAIWSKEKAGAGRGESIPLLAHPALLQIPLCQTPLL